MNTELLKALFKDQAILPDDNTYDEARIIYNAMIDKKPAAIIKCGGVEDVVKAVNFARKEDMEVSILGGGHNGAGLALVDDGLVIDLSEMNKVQVNPDNKTVRVQGGCTWAEVDEASHEHGLAVPSGIISTTGVGGLTLGGGHGYLTRQYGLTIDNLLEVEVVLANGQIVTANAHENQDLFWASRGGGGNFGVVTHFLFQAHPVKNVYGGPIIWPIDQAEEIMRWYRDFIQNAPQELYGWFGFNRVPTGSPLPEELHGEHGCVICWCYTGPRDQAEEVFKPIRELGTPVLDLVDEIPFPALQSMFDEMYYPPGLQWYWKGAFVDELTDQAIEKHQEYGSNMPSELCTMHLYPINGAVHDVDKNDTAFSYRDATWSQVIVGVDSSPDNAEMVSQWAKEYWQALQPHSKPSGGYVNFMMEEGVDRIKDTYRDNYDRLALIKAKYDPDNFFHINQNIKPKAA